MKKVRSSALTLSLFRFIIHSPSETKIENVQLSGKNTEDLIYFFVHLQLDFLLLCNH